MHIRHDLSRHATAAAKLNAIIVMGLLFGITACTNARVNPPVVNRDESAVVECSYILVYRQVRLGKVISDVNRCFGSSILMGDTAVEGLVFSGTIYRAHVRELLVGLDFSYPQLKIDITDPSRIVIRSREPSDLKEKD
jgi:ferric-dicitrate binding protein FerR (iron transport regulator)